MIKGKAFYTHDMQAGNEQMSTEDKVYILLYIILLVLSALLIYIIVEDLYYCKC